METNNIAAAPQMANVSHFYERWRKTNVGSKDQFYKFLTTPSTERDEFFRSALVSTAFSGAVLTVTAQLFSAGPVISPINPDIPVIPVTPTL